MAPAQVPAPAGGQPPPAAAALPIPQEIFVSKLIWSTMAAVDHANRTGNYSVLRDLGAPGFQANNTAASLAGVFNDIRTQGYDVGNTLLVVPNYEIPPTIVEGGLMRVRGTFPLRPKALAFDLLFQPAGGRWALFGIALAAVPAAPATTVPNPPARRR